MKNRNVLLTGATGIMGSWVLGEALARGYQPLVLLRDPDLESASRRIEIVMRHVDRPADASKVRVILGDARKPNFGLDPHAARKLRTEIGGIIHCAAGTSFNPDQDQECWDINVGGVRHLLDFASEADINYYHVSTAYVSGLRRGAVLETELDEGQSFNNTYERSKCEAEKLVHAAFDSGKLRGCIFRPSIITGSTRDGRILQFVNFYNVLRLLDLLTTRRSSSGEIRVVADPNGYKNLIPVDWTVAALWNIIEREGSLCKTYHLTNPNPIRQGDLLTWSNELLNQSGVHVVMVPEILSEPSSLEAIVSKGFSNYQPYMHGEPIFDRTNTDAALNGQLPFPDLGPAYFATMLEFARRKDWHSQFGGVPLRSLARPRRTDASVVDPEERPLAADATPAACSSISLPMSKKGVD